MSAPPNNPLKLPFLRFCAAIGALAAAVGVLSQTWWLVALGLVLLGGTVWPVHIIRHGRNPRWLRSPLDGRWPRRRD